MGHYYHPLVSATGGVLDHSGGQLIFVVAAAGQLVAAFVYFTGRAPPGRAAQCDLKLMPPLRLLHGAEGVHGGNHCWANEDHEQGRQDEEDHRHREHRRQTCRFFLGFQHPFVAGFR